MINVVVEGESDREVAKAVVRGAGGTVNIVRVAGGKSRLDPLIPKYNRAAGRNPWVVFRDSDGRCPVELRAELGRDVTNWDPKFSLRIAHSMSEAWLLADAETFADYFGVKRARIVNDPESLAHAKRALLALCSQSHSRAIRKDVTAIGGGAGPLYVQRINDYAASMWRVDVASTVSLSLGRAISRIAQLSVA